MSEPFLGQLSLTAINYAPYGWALCQGQLLSISQNTALFSLLGTAFGGDGRVTFGLPDLRGRVPVGAGQGPGLTPRQLGETAGEELHLINMGELPMHTHAVQVNSGRGTLTTTPVNNYPANGSVSTTPFAPAGASSPLNQQLNAKAVYPTGGNQPHENRAPVLTLNWIIAMNGIFPPRS